MLLSRAVQERVRAALPAGCSLRDWGEHRLKDLRYSEHIFQLLAPDLPDVAAALRTAEALAPRDRVIVADPDAPDADPPESALGQAPVPAIEGLWARLASAVRAEAASSQTVRLTVAEAASLARARARSLSS